MLDAIDQAQRFVKGMRFEQFRRDEKTCRAIERCLEIVSEGSRHVPVSVQAGHPEIPWRQIAHMRDTLIHRYFSGASG